MAVNATVLSLGQFLGPLFAGIAFDLWGMRGVFYAGAGFAIATLYLLIGLFAKFPKKIK